MGWHPPKRCGAFTPSRCNSASTVRWSLVGRLGSHCFFRRTQCSLTNRRFLAAIHAAGRLQLGSAFRGLADRRRATNRCLRSVAAGTCVARAQRPLAEAMVPNCHRLSHFRTIHLAHGVRRHWPPFASGCGGAAGLSIFKLEHRPH